MVDFRISNVAPNHMEVTYWVDLTANRYKGVIKYYDADTKTWKPLNDIANDDQSAAIAALQTGKVDKVAGKQLSTNDFTNALKTKLDGLNNYDDSALVAIVDAKVDKVSGKQLSTNDYTDDDMQDVGEMRTNLTRPETGGKGFYNVWEMFSKSVKGLALVKDAAGIITGGTLTLIDDTTIPVTITTAPTA